MLLLVKNVSVLGRMRQPLNMFNSTLDTHARVNYHSESKPFGITCQTFLSGEKYRFSRNRAYHKAIKRFHLLYVTKLIDR